MADGLARIIEGNTVDNYLLSQGRLDVNHGAATGWGTVMFPAMQLWQ
jgi:hypothetical protein